jgi:cellulose synthase subunit
MTRALVSALLATLSLHSAAAAARTPESPPRPPGLVRLQFGDHLKIPPELQLSGATDARSALFTLPARWKVLPGSALHLFVRHSEDLDGNRSFLSVTLNYGILRSFRLDSQNAALTEVVVPIPPASVKQHNTLVVSVEQFLRPNAGSRETWSSISARSFLELRYAEEPLDLSLGRLPSTLLEPHTLSANRLAVLLPRRFDPATLEATALLVANFSRRPAGERITTHIVRSVQAARDPLLIVGTPAEQPELVALKDRLPLAVASARGRTALPRTGTATAGEPEGVVGLTTRPAADQTPILVVSGDSGAGVLRAARSVLAPGWTASGNFARVTTEPRPVTSRAREWPGFIPPRSLFTLGDLGLDDLKITADRNYSLTVPLNAMPDARFFDYGHRMVLRFRLSPDLVVGDARLLVQMNEITLADDTVNDTFRRSIGSVSVTIPPHALKPRNLLRISWIGPAHGASQGVVAWLLSTSELYLPRYHETELPDLGLLQFQLYPFSLKGDLSDVLVVPPSDAGEETFAAVVALSSAFARLAPAQPLAFRVKRLAELTESDRAESHLVVLNLEDRRDALTALLPGWKPRLPAEALRGRPLIREMVSPWNRERYLLVISAPSGRLLLQTVVDAFAEPNLRELRGDVASLAGGRVESFVTGPRRKIQEYSYQALVEAWLRTYWLALPLILITVSGLLFVGVRLALRHYRPTSS